MAEELILKENDRAKLDDIVSKMQTNKESDANIKFVVDDFKSKYGTSTSPESDAKKKYTYFSIGFTLGSISFLFRCSRTEA